MKSGKKKYDSTVARIAGNLLSGMTRLSNDPDGLLNDAEKRAAMWAVNAARAIVAHVERTEPQGRDVASSQQGSDGGL